MKLPENEVHVWYFNVDDFTKDVEIYRSFLTLEEIVKSNKFKFEKDRNLSIMARSILRILSGQYLDIEMNAIDFEYGTYGKPDYNFSTEIKFNVSHSGKFIVLAFVKNSEIGVDVEKIKCDFDVLNLAENFFSAMEIKMLHDVKKQEVYRTFYRCWTRKESFIKAKGSGLNFPLASFSVSLKDDSAKLLKTAWNPAEKEEWNLFTFEPTPGYIGALSVNKRIQSIKYFDNKTLLAVDNLI